MRNKTILRFIIATALLILALPALGAAQVYQYGYERADRYNQLDRRDVRDAINRLDNSGAQLERDLNRARGRSVLGGLFWVRNVDSNAIAEVRDFRAALRELRRSVRGDYSLSGSTGEARVVIDRGLQLDRYLRLRTGDAGVDEDLANLRSNLHVLADAYGISLRY